MSQITEIILKAGILSPEALREMRRWGLPVGEAEELKELEAPPTPESISRSIADAIESEGYILTRETDLEAIPQYLQGMQPGVLHVVLDDQGEPEFEVQVAQVSSGDWILPWHSDSITDLLINGQTYLRVKGERIFFSQARELFYGARKAFVVCTPATQEPDRAGT